MYQINLFINIWKQKIYTNSLNDKCSSRELINLHYVFLTIE